MRPSHSSGFALPALIFGMSGCDESRHPTADTCDALCAELVTDCATAAFPSVDSCVQGCLFSADQGGDLDGQLGCVEAAACDPFAVVECEHQFGLGADAPVP